MPSKAVEWKYYIQCTQSTLHSGCLEPELAAPPAELMPSWGWNCMYGQPASSLQQGFLKGHKCKSQASCHFCCWHLESKQEQRERSVWAQLCSSLLLWMVQLCVCVCACVCAWEYVLLTEPASTLKDIDRVFDKMSYCINETERTISFNR